MAEEIEAPAEPDWVDIRARYEGGAEKVAQIAAAIGLAGVTLSRRAEAEGWMLRCARAVAPGIEKPAADKTPPAITQKPAKAESTRQLCAA
jgi:hypothetical protein